MLLPQVPHPKLGLWGLGMFGLALLPWWRGDRHPVQCAGPEEPSGMHWPACDAVSLVEASRVATWRSQQGLPKASSIEKIKSRLNFSIED